MIAGRLVYSEEAIIGKFDFVLSLSIPKSNGGKHSLGRMMMRS